MAKFIQIQVPTPCHEKWEHMQPRAEGSFCNSCQKTVIDFTKMTDNQLMAYFKKPAANVCGRFYTEQLETAYALPVKRIPWLKYFLQISIPALLFNIKATAQHLIKKNMVVTEQLEKKQASILLPEHFVINGSITNFSGEPVPYATVMIAGTNKGIATDSMGRYSLKLAANDTQLEITAVGYEKKIVTITSKREDIQLDILTSDAVVLTAGMGTRTSCTVIAGATRVSVSTYIKSAKTQLVEKKSLPAANVELFPTPVKRNGSLTIRWKKPVHNDQKIIVYNASGVVLMQKVLHTKLPLLQEQIDLDLDAAGYYVMHVIDSKTNKQEDISFIVE
jgi:hypothetical protein